MRIANSTISLPAQVAKNPHQPIPPAPRAVKPGTLHQRGVSVSSFRCQPSRVRAEPFYAASSPARWARGEACARGAPRVPPATNATREASHLSARSNAEIVCASRLGRGRRGRTALLPRPERIVIDIRSLDKLAVREPDKMVQMLRLRRVVREGQRRKGENENCHKPRETIIHLPLQSPVIPLGSKEIPGWSPRLSARRGLRLIDPFSACPFRISPKESRAWFPFTAIPPRSSAVLRGTPSTSFALQSERRFGLISSYAAARHDQQIRHR